jgi:hypothetical protein
MKIVLILLNNVDHWESLKVKIINSLNHKQSDRERKMNKILQETKNACFTTLKFESEFFKHSFDHIGHHLILNIMRFMVDFEQ